MNTDQTETDIVIIGAGPAGLATANYLGLYGVRAIVIERNAGTVAEPRAVSIDDESLRAMQTLGLVDKIVPRTLPGYGARYYTPGQREFARIKPTTLEFGHPRRSAFHQPELEAVLLDGLARFPAIEVLFEHIFETAEQDADGVTVTITGPDGAEKTIRAKFLAGCDGGRSAVRRVIGATLAGSSFEERWLVFDTINDTDDTPDSVAHCDHRRPAITLPGFGGTRRWEFLVHPGEDPDHFLKEDTIRGLLRPYIGDRPVEIIRKVVYTFQARIADRWRDGRIFLLGDAAHLTPPYAGQGLNSGQRDAANFAWKAAAVVRGAFSDRLMETYEAERRDHAWSLIQMAIQIGRVMVPRNWLHTYGQAAFFRIAGLIPRFRDYIMGLKFKPVPRFEEGFLRPDGLSAKQTLIGRMLPQPVVTLPGGKTQKLDELLGPGFALLAIGTDGDIDIDIGNAGLSALEAIGVARVALSVDGAAPERPAVRTASLTPGALPPVFKPYLGKILLVRPDRYVAASITPGDRRAVDNIRAALDAFS